MRLTILALNLRDMRFPDEKGLEYTHGPMRAVSQGVREPSPMRNPYEVLKAKELELARVKKEIEALRITARLIGLEEPGNGISLAKGDSRQVVEMP